MAAPGRTSGRSISTGRSADVFAFQDRITADVAMIVGPQIQMAEIERSRRERPGSIAAYDAYLQAVPMINKETAKENAEAYALLTRALALEPDNALLLSHAAWALGHRSAMGWPPIGRTTPGPAWSWRGGRCSTRREIRRCWRIAG